MGFFHRQVLRSAAAPELRDAAEAPHFVAGEVRQGPPAAPCSSVSMTLSSEKLAAFIRGG